MSDLIERDKAISVIDRCKHRLQGQGSTYEIMLDMMKAIPSADVVSLEEFEQMRFLADKSMEMVGEERPKEELTDVLAELHERFDALEKEIRRASAEISAIIRANLDRPKGEWIDAEIPLESGGSMPIQACNLCKTFYPLAYTGGGHRFCPNCGASMREREGE